MINAECGSNDWRKNGSEIGGNLRASLFDRNIRGNIAFCDRFTAFSLWADKPFTFLAGSVPLLASSSVSDVALTSQEIWCRRTGCGADRGQTPGSDPRFPIHAR